MDGVADNAVSAQWSVSLIIPAYNEEAGISHAIKEADDALRGMAAKYEILVVDDGSSDGTSARVLVSIEKYPAVRLLQHAENRGYGAALRTGFDAANHDYVAFTDADSQFDLHDLKALLKLSEQSPIAVGYRADRQDSWRRRIYSRGYNLLVRGLLGTRVRDCDCALKVYRHQEMAHLLPDTDGFLVNAEMLTRARRRGYHIAEVGVRHRPRVHGQSKVSIADIPRTLAALVPYWWSKIAFPNGTSSFGDHHRSSRNLTWIGLFFVAVIASLLFFTRMNGPLLEPDEARYAEIPRQMLSAGNFVVPTLHGQPYYHKPPLLYWLVMTSYTAFGIQDWAARLVPCLAAFLTILVTYLWGCRAIGTRGALIGALMLCLSARFIYLGRMLTMDSLLGLWVVVSWAAAYAAIFGCSRLAAAHRAARFYEPQLNRMWWTLSAVSCGLGILTKGPVALVLVAVPVMAFQLLDPRTARLRWRPWLTFLAMATAVASPWYVLVSIRDAAFLSDFFWTHNFVRYVAPLDHEEPFWYFVPGLLLGMMPWTLLLPAMCKLLSRRFGVKACRRSAGLGFVLLTGIWCFVLYSAAGCKRPGYIIPAMPPLALALGFTLHSILPINVLAHARTLVAQAQARLAYRATLLVIIGGMSLCIAATVSGIIRADVAFLLSGAALTALALTVRLGPLNRVAGMWGMCAASTLIVLAIGLHSLLPGYEHRFSLRAQIQPQRSLMQVTQLPVVCYPRRWDSVSFYLERDDVAVYAAIERQRLIEELRRRPETVLFVKTDTPDKTPLRDLLRDLPASLEFVPFCRHGIVTAGLVRKRTEAPAMLLARTAD